MMTEGVLQPRHFSSKLLDDLRYWRKLREDNGGTRQLAHEWIEELLPLAVHFVLPDGGRIFDDGFRGLESGLRLPFPVVALEYVSPDVGGNEFAKDGFWSAPERVALSIDLRQSCSRPDPSVMSEWATIKNLEDGIIVMGFVIVDDEIHRWVPVPGAFWFNPDIVEVPPPATPEQLAEIQRFYKADKLTAAKKMFTDSRFLILDPDVFDRTVAKYGYKDAQLMMCADVNDEKNAVFEFMEAMSCANVCTARIPAPTKLNTKRAKAGRVPIYEYRVLTLTLPGTKQTDSGSTHDNRASPRVHLRRGHIRRLPDKKVWVNAAVIGAKESGILHKDYRVETRV